MRIGPRCWGVSVHCQLLVLSAQAICAALICGCAAPPEGAWGRYKGNIRVEMLDDGRGMRLLEDFAYHDAHGNKWRAPKGAVIDGASIPKAFWSVIGGPFEGRYRAASIIHDVYCAEETHTAEWEDVHRMFYRAMRCSGVEDSRAKLMYWAVYRFGPRWELRTKINPKTGRMTESLRLVTRPAPSTVEAMEAKEFIIANDPSLKEIRGLSNTNGVLDPQ